MQREAKRRRRHTQQPTSVSAQHAAKGATIQRPCRAGEYVGFLPFPVDRM
jgi:hypothetical protein